MTDKRKDDLPLVQEINDLFRVCETDNDLARCIMDVLKERGLMPSPPVPNDIEAIIFKAQFAKHWQSLANEIEKKLGDKIRAPSTPSAEVQELRQHVNDLSDALKSVISVSDRKTVEYDRAKEILKNHSRSKT